MNTDSTEMVARFRNIILTYWVKPIAFRLMLQNLKKALLLDAPHFHKIGTFMVSFNFTESFSLIQQVFSIFVGCHKKSHVHFQ